MSEDRITKQEYEEKSQELYLEVFHMMDKADKAKTDQERDYYHNKALKALADGGKLENDYKRQQERDDEQPSDNGYYDDGL